MFIKKQRLCNVDMLVELIRQDDLESTKNLIKSRSTSVQVDERGWTLLHYAARYNSVNTAKYLLKRLHPDMANSDGITPIHLAAWYKATEVFALLLTEGANFLAKDKQGWSPLALAAWRNHASIIHLLLTAGCWQNARQKSGYTPLHFAAWNNSYEALKLLVEAKTKQKSCNGITPLVLAQVKQNRAVLSYLTGKDEDLPMNQPSQNHTELPKELNSKNLRQFIQHLTQPRLTPQLSAEQLRPFTPTEDDIFAENIENSPPILYQQAVSQPEQLSQAAPLCEAVALVAETSPLKQVECIPELPSGINSYTYSSKIALEQLKQASDGETGAVEPDHYAAISLSGNKLISQTEAIIANILYSLKIPFYYQRKICGTVDPGVYYPAFSFFDKNNKLIVWEHLSDLIADLTDQQAQDVFRDCKQWYQNNGFILNESFFLTSESTNQPFDSRTALHIAEKIKEKI